MRGKGIGATKAVGSTRARRSESALVSAACRRLSRRPGPKYVGAIHGRFLLAASLSTVLGPGLLLNLRQAAETKALSDLLARVDPTAFVAKFGTDVNSAQSLIEAKTLTINKLMTIMPPGTVDPSPFLYNNTMYTMSALVGVAAALHFMVRPVDKKYFEKVEEEK